MSRKPVWRFLYLAISLPVLAPITAFAQTQSIDYCAITLDNYLEMDFSAPTLESGTANTIGAVYRFNDVAVGVDAIVTVTDLEAANTIDLALNDGSLAGTLRNDEPNNVANAHFGYDVDLVAADTTTLIPPVDILLFSADIDGQRNRTLQEFVEFANSDFMFLGDVNSELEFVTGTVGDRAIFTNITEADPNTKIPFDPLNVAGAIYLDTNNFSIYAGFIENYDLSGNVANNRRGLEYLATDERAQVGAPVCFSNGIIRTSDWSDAPIAGTSYGEALHNLDNNNFIRLGSAVDADASSIANADASGDGADDDGVSVIPAIGGIGDSFTLNVTVSNLSTLPATLHGWADFNDNGQFETSEYVSAPVPTGTNNATTALSWTQNAVPTDATYVRLRISSDALTAADFETLASNGEVEDYEINSGVAELSGQKTVAIWDPLGQGLYSVPGVDAIYTIEISNNGNGEADTDTVFLTDRLPAEVEFYNGDIDDAGPETDAVSFTETNSNLTFNYATDVAYDDGATTPTSFAECDYVPAAGYDPAITYVCFNPKGAFNHGSPTPTASFSFRTRIK